LKPESTVTVSKSEEITVRKIETPSETEKKGKEIGKVNKKISKKAKDTKILKENIKADEVVAKKEHVMREERVSESGLDKFSERKEVVNNVSHAPKTNGIDEVKGGDSDVSVEKPAKGSSGIGNIAKKAKGKTKEKKGISTDESEKPVQVKALKPEKRKIESAAEQMTKKDESTKQSGRKVQRMQGEDQIGLTVEKSAKKDLRIGRMGKDVSGRDAESRKRNLTDASAERSKKKQRSTLDVKEQLSSDERVKKPPARNDTLFAKGSDTKTNASAPSLSPAISHNSTPNRTPTNQYTPPGNSPSAAPARNATPKRARSQVAQNPNQKRARGASHHHRDPRLKEATALRKRAQSETNKYTKLKYLFSGSLKLLAAIDTMLTNETELPQVAAEWIFYGRRVFFEEIESKGKELNLVGPTIAAMFSKLILQKFMLEATSRVNKLNPKSLKVDWKPGEKAAQQQRQAFTSVFQYMLEEDRVKYMLEYERKMTFDKVKKVFPNSDQDLLRIWEVVVGRIIEGREKDVVKWVSRCEEIREDIMSPEDHRKKGEETVKNRKKGEETVKTPRREHRPRRKAVPRGKRRNSGPMRQRDRKGDRPDRTHRRQGPNAQPDKQRSSSSSRYRRAGPKGKYNPGTNREQNRGKRS